MNLRSQTVLLKMGERMSNLLGSGKKKIAIITLLSVLGVAFLISLISVLVIEGGTHHILLSFPNARDKKELILRARYAVNRNTKEEKVKELVRQLGLGPNEEKGDVCESIFPAGMEAEAVFITDGQLLVELPTVFILQEAEMVYTVDHSLEILEYNLVYNFNWIRELVITVEGVELLRYNFQKSSTVPVINDESGSEPEEETE